MIGHAKRQRLITSITSQAFHLFTYIWKPVAAAFSKLMRHFRISWSMNDSISRTEPTKRCDLIDGVEVYKNPHPENVVPNLVAAEHAKIKKFLSRLSVQLKVPEVPSCSARIVLYWTLKLLLCYMVCEKLASEAFR